MMNVANPYKPPPSIDSGLSVSGGRSHDWQGRKLAVSSCGSPVTLWMENVITVSIDDSEMHREKAFHFDDHFRFSFLHDGRMVDAQVRRGWGFFARCIKYELIVDGESVAKSWTPIENWMRGVAVMLAVNLLIFGLFGSYLISF